MVAAQRPGRLARGACCLSVPDNWRRWIVAYAASCASRHFMQAHVVCPGQLASLDRCVSGIVRFTSLDVGHHHGGVVCLASAVRITRLARRLLIHPHPWRIHPYPWKIHPMQGRRGTHNPPRAPCLCHSLSSVASRAQIQLNRNPHHGNATSWPRGPRPQLPSAGEFRASLG